MAGALLGTDLREEELEQVESRMPNGRTQVPPGRTARDRGGAAEVDADGLAVALREAIQGEVRFTDGDRALYATDGSNYRQTPIGVVLPKSLEDVAAAVAIARRFHAPLLSRGGGTSLAGQCCNTAVIMDMSKYLHHVLEIDPQRKLGRVQPGCVLDDLRGAAISHGLTFGPDPATHTRCTLGGMLGNNSCGVHSIMARKAGTGSRTADNTYELEILTYDGLRMKVGATSEEEVEAIIRQGGRRGEIYSKLRALRNRYAPLIRERFPKIPRRVSGYNLDELLPENGFHVARALVGTESTCVVVLEATLHLIPNPQARSLLVLGYPDVFHAADHVTEVMQFAPIGLEGMDDLLFEWVKQSGAHPHGVELMPHGNGWLLLEFGGESKEDSDEQARRCMEALKRLPEAPSMKLLDDPAEEKEIWEIREGSLASTTWVPGNPDTWPGWEDSAVPPDKTGPYLRDLKKLMAKYGYHPSLYGHFGDGCIHCRVGFDMYTAEGIRSYHSFVEEAADLVVRYGGTLSGEHGDGQSRAELLPRMFGPELVQAFREFKQVWDPEGKMNPGKVVDPYPIDANLRLGPNYRPAEPETHFRFIADRGSFARAALRCVGVANCREHGGKTMCPSYQVTREEKHSTRGRARLLFEMLRGETLKDGWKSEEVKEALDLCLSCKGCKGECPVQVDMATYKAEFLSHYYEGRTRPRSAYAFGLLSVWARLAAAAPEIVNLITQTPVLRDLARWSAGIARERKIPPFAAQTFKAWFCSRGIRGEGRQQIILWPDTFNNYFHPEVAQAATEVLEAAGFQVVVPAANFCCGRPLYDFGMLDTAKAWLREILTGLQPQIEAGVPIVGLEPSCVSVFRDELTNLFPHDQNALRLSRQAMLLGEFLTKFAPEFEVPKLQGKVLLHRHCHEKALMKSEDEQKLLQRMGLSVEAPATGCCGMAGSFGFEAGEHYEVSRKCGERTLLPAVRAAEPDTLVVADGFSCREQISQCTDRQGLHLAQVLQLGLQENGGRAGVYPERRCTGDGSADAVAAKRLRTAAYMGGGILLAGLAVWTVRRMRERN